MATLAELCESGVLTRIDPLDSHEQPMRRLYGIESFIRWLDQYLPGLDGNPLYAELSPLEQVFALFAEYVSGSDFVSDRRFKKLNCTPDRFVWQLKTEDVRIFGWVPQRDAFICCFGDSADEIKLKASYGRYIAQTVYERDQIDLDEPKCVTGREYADVISDED